MNEDPTIQESINPENPELGGMENNQENPFSRKPRVVIVDDQRDSRRFAEICLKSDNIECFPFEKGSQAIEFVKSEPVDVILLDVMMPDMDGYEVCEKIKELPNAKDIPILFLSAKYEFEDKVHGLKIGGHDYLTKPINMQELRARTHAAFRVKVLQDELKKKIELQQTINQIQQTHLNDYWRITFEQLAASLAHELNNPLAAALGSTQLLKRQEWVDENSADQLEKIGASLKTASQKLRSLLLIAHAGQRPQQVCLSRLVEDLVTLVNYRIVSNKIELSVDLQGETPWTGGPGQLARAVMALLNNSMEAVTGEAHPAIQILTGEDEKLGELWISICDNGPGVPLKIQDRLFEPFVTDKGPPHGGVGLPLAKRIIEQYQGRLEWIQRASDTMPTEFRITLPYKTVETPNKTETSAISQAHNPIDASAETGFSD
jgi:two-component system, sensor histidine kinase and response regulator